jgi:DNA-binding transcriptional regulator YiaG
MAEPITNIDGTTFAAPRLTRSAVRQARSLLALSQPELGRLVGLTGTSISNFENGPNAQPAAPSRAQDLRLLCRPRRRPG